MFGYGNEGAATLVQNTAVIMNWSDLDLKNNLKLRGFPAQFKTKQSLIETFTRMLWLAVGQHTAVGYPVADYATYVPNVSTKLYDIYGVPDDTFNGARLNNRKTSAELYTNSTFVLFSHTSFNCRFFFKIGTFRYDRIFDYADKLQDARAKAIITRYKRKMDGPIEAMLEERNRKRLRQGHLTYPYLQPKWLPNGVQE
ncbi:hypothetical protein QZH41_017138 [Actinostola sp. cb2023]|nr:hypothetical protein QZH41_017138 [Actinostola sp. cb2023]